MDTKYLRLAIVFLFMFAAWTPASATEVVPVLVEGNPTCAELGQYFEYKVDPPNEGTYPIGDGINAVKVITPDGVYLDWSSSLGIDAVIVKGGDAANVYYYDPEAFSDSGLHSPVNNGGSIAAISHISFCYDYEVDVTKTAETSLTRTFDWSIDKSADQSSLVLSPGQQFLVNYLVQLGATSLESDWAVEGEIHIFNPAPVSATIESVSDLVEGGILASVDCPVLLPASLGSGNTLVCSYSADLPDGSLRLNTATVETSGMVGGDSGQALVDFSSASINGVDECVSVSDSMVGDLGVVCASDLPASIGYSYYVGPFTAPDGCGDHLVENLASFVAGDSGAEGQDSWVIQVEVPCLSGCSLTPGYWKTHSEFGPAPYDDTWAQLSNGASTLFFDTGASWYKNLWTPPQGNAFYILAHAYIAAYLNGLNGADTSAIDGLLIDAAKLLDSYDTNMDAIRGAVRRAFIQAAGILDDYNNGIIGPGHCSE